MTLNSRPLRLALFSLLILAGMLLSGALALHQGERRALLDESAQTREQLGTTPTPWTP